MHDAKHSRVTLVIIDLIPDKSCKCEMHSYVLEVFIFLILSTHGSRCFDAVKLFVVTKRIQTTTYILLQVNILCE